MMTSKSGVTEAFRVVRTEDQSDSLWSERFGALYHSHRGACEESRHVFLAAGFEFCQKVQPVRILEVGLGTGLNALLTWQAARQSNCQVEYTGIEPFPIPPSLVTQLNYPELLAGPCESAELLGENLRQFHAARPNEWQWLDEHFTFRRFEQPLKEVDWAGPEFSLVYYDAFSPADQPSMWALDHLQHLSLSLQDQAVLVTYCASSQFKRNLRASGFEVFALPGCLGKREMTRAVFHRQD